MCVTFTTTLLLLVNSINNATFGKQQCTSKKEGSFWHEWPMSSIICRKVCVCLCVCAGWLGGWMLMLRRSALLLFLIYEAWRLDIFLAFSLGHKHDTVGQMSSSHPEPGQYINSKIRNRKMYEHQLKSACKCKWSVDDWPLEYIIVINNVPQTQI